MGPMDPIVWLRGVLAGMLGWFEDLAVAVVAWVLSYLSTPLDWLIGQIPTIDLPSWAVPIPAMVHTMMTYAAAMAFWVPVELLSPVVGFVVGSFLICMGIRLARIIASIASGGGGA